MGYLSNNILTAAGAGMNFMQAQQSAAVSRMEAELAADNIEAQARRKDLEAREAVELGRLDQAEAVVKGRAEMAGLKSSYAASGVSVNSGSAVETVADKAAWTDYQRQKIEYGAAMESWGLKYDAALLRQESHNTRISGAKSANTAQLALSTGKQLGSLILT